MTDLRAADLRHVWHPFTQMAAYAGEKAPIIESGEGVFLVDTEGRRYYDGVSSLWCNVHGHRHPRIDAAVRDQLGRIAHSTLLGLGSGPSILLAERLAGLTGLPRVFYADSGAGAVEIAMKVAFQFASRRDPRRTRFVSFRNAYHGDTLGAVSVGGIDLFHEAFRPLLFETLFAPSPFPYRWPGEDCRAEALLALERILDENARTIAAVVMEPKVQGAAGLIVHPDGFLAEVRRMTRDRGILLVCDEVATGFGRTGRMFAVEHEEVRPDALVLGKGISAGYLPLSAACFTEEIYEDFLGRHEEMRHFLHGHTYTGNALACSAGLASLEVFREEKVLESLPAKTALVAGELEALRRFDGVGDIRACGLMAGIELVADRFAKTPFPPALRAGHRVILEARKRGMILRPLGDVVVFMPPLAASHRDLAAMMEILEASIEVFEKERRT